MAPCFYCAHPGGYAWRYAVYTPNQYTITFDTDGGSEIATITHDYGTAITAPAAPTKTGYTFAGWDAEIPATMPAENVTIKAKWTINQYTITFVDEDGTVLQSSEVAYGEKPVYTGKTPTKAATVQYTYTFNGWDKEVSKSVPDDKAKVEAKLGDGNVAMYLDVSMFVEIGGIQEFKLTELTEKTTISFKLPDSFIHTDKDVTRTYSIIHVHDGKAEIITPVFDAATKTLTFETDKFSTYALVYIDLENTPSTQETTPPTDIPATGDSFDMMMWATMLVMSSIAIIVLLANRKRFMYKAKYVRK